MPLPDKISELPEAVRQALEVALAAEQNKDKTAARGLKRGASSADLWDDAVEEAPKVRVHTKTDPARMSANAPTKSTKPMTKNSMKAADDAKAGDGGSDSTTASSSLTWDDASVHQPMREFGLSNQAPTAWQRTLSSSSQRRQGKRKRQQR